MKGLTISCYAIAFCMLGLSVKLLMPKTSQIDSTSSQLSVQDFGISSHR